jgi:hypothetical protein
MRTSTNSRWIWVLCGAVFALLPAAAILSHPRAASAVSAMPAARQSTAADRPQTQQQDPWTAAQTVDPATLVKEIGGPASQRPTVVSVSPHALYLGGHIAGAVYEGPGFSAAGIESLKQWAQRLPRSTNLVVYCGCCPLVHCPNLRPAFRALQSMGFTRVRALILPTNFYTDWYSKGYPTDKGN